MDMGKLFELRDDFRQSLGFLEDFITIRSDLLFARSQVWLISFYTLIYLYKKVLSCKDDLNSFKVD